MLTCVMGLQRVLIVGAELFATALTSLLAEEATVRIVDWVPTIDDALPILNADEVDVIIISAPNEPDISSIHLRLSICANIKIIKMCLGSDYMDVIIQKRVAADPAELIAIFGALP